MICLFQQTIQRTCCGINNCDNSIQYKLWSSFFIIYKYEGWSFSVRVPGSVHVKHHTPQTRPPYISLNNFFSDKRVHLWTYLSQKSCWPNALCHNDTGSQGSVCSSRPLTGPTPQDQHQCLPDPHSEASQDIGEFLSPHKLLPLATESGRTKYHTRFGTFSLLGEVEAVCINQNTCETKWHVHTLECNFRAIYAPITTYLRTDQNRYHRSCKPPNVA